MAVQLQSYVSGNPHILSSIKIASSTGAAKVIAECTLHGLHTLQTGVFKIEWARIERKMEAINALNAIIMQQNTIDPAHQVYLIDNIQYVRTNGECLEFLVSERNLPAAEAAHPARARYHPFTNQYDYAFGIVIPKLST